MPRTRAEIGNVGLPIFAGYLSLDPNTNLRGAQAAQTYRQMRYDEPAAAAFVNACYQLLRTDLFVEPGGVRDADKRAAEFLESCLGDMRDSIGTTLRQGYSYIYMGWGIQELVYKRRLGGQGSRYDDGRVGWAAWGLRRQESLYRWVTDLPTGRILAFQQRPAPTYDLRTIPLSKVIHLTADDSEGSPEGLSAFRPMYRQWYFVKNLELLAGIAHERGAGFPVFEIDKDTAAALTPEDKATLETVAANLRQNEEAYILTPPAVHFRFAEMPGMQPESYMNTIQRMRAWMLATVLADFIGLGLGDRGGAFALGKDKSELFLMALNGYQQRLLDVLNRHAVARLFRYNDFGRLSDLPRLALPAVKRYDLDAMGKFAEILSRIGALHLTPEDEAFFRTVGDLPEVDAARLAAAHAPDAPADDTVGGAGDASTQIFGYHIEQGVVDINEARARLGLPPRADVGTDLRYREKLTAMKVAQQAVASGYPIDVALAMAGLSPDGELIPAQPLAPGQMPAEATPDAPEPAGAATEAPGEVPADEAASTVDTGGGTVGDDDVAGTPEAEVAVDPDDEGGEPL